jgi:hypothetical protein
MHIMVPMDQTCYFKTLIRKATFVNMQLQNVEGQLLARDYTLQINHTQTSVLFASLH